MIIAKIVQKGQIITLEDVVTTFQYSANLKMQFVIDESYKDCIITGWYRKFWKKEEKNLLDMQEDGTFLLGQDVFENDGTVEFSFALNYQDGKIIVHLGVVEYYVKKSFGNGDAILPEETETWISVVSRVVKDQMSDNWDKDYKPQLEENLNIIEDKTSEIISAAEKVKQDALESSTNARNALESANLAKNSADSAKEAEEKALEHMSNAEKFKNSASSFAEQADLAKNSALESATNASNSASNALDNANKAKEHLDSVNTAVNNFNTDYAQKINEFNTNYATKKEAFDTAVNNANTALNATITEANTSINSKVAEASAQANIAKQEADRATLATDGKLDKNQGTDNAGKAMVVDEEGNIIPDEAGINNDEVNALIDSAIKEKLYTQEEVDYLLRDKMDKSYADITITEDTTIDCTMDGNLKIDTIEGKSVQNVEENIVPTPARPIPITSKKTLAGGEYVELRSLKESVNLFDLGLQSQVDLIPLEGSYRKINIPLQLKANTQYTYSYEASVIPALMYIVLNIIDNTGTIIKCAINNSNPSNIEIETKANKTTFISPNNGKVYFSCYLAEFEDSGEKVKTQTISYFKENWYTKILKNIMLVEGSTAPSTYIPPTARDYKIVDHTNKKAYIERNIQKLNLNDLNYIYIDTKTDYSRFYSAVNPQLKFIGEIYSNVFEGLSSYNYTKEGIYGGNGQGGKTLSIIVKDSNITAHTQEALLAYINNPNAITYYALETPVIEEISYLESDTSEFGESFQDSTSPSPTIPSDLKAVTELNVKCIGKNLLDENYFFNNNSWSNYELNIELLPNTKYTFSRVNNLGYQSGIFLKILNTIEGTSSQIINSNSQTMNKSNVTFTTLDSGVITFSIQGIKPKELKDVLGYAQLEAGDTATEYEPYQENSIRYALEKPLLKIGDIADTINITKENRENKLNSIVLDGSEDETWNINDLGYETTIRFQYTVVTSNYPSGTNHKVNCNKFNNILGDISNREYVRLTSAGNGYSYLWVYIKKIRLEEVSVTGFKKWLRENPLKVIYDTSYVFTEPLEVELMEKLRQLKTYSPTTNIFIEGEVKPIYNCRYPKDLLLAQQKLESTVLTLQEEVVKNV